MRFKPLILISAILILLSTSIAALEPEECNTFGVGSAHIESSSPSNAAPNTTNNWIDTGGNKNRAYQLFDISNQTGTASDSTLCVEVKNKYTYNGVVEMYLTHDSTYDVATLTWNNQPCGNTAGVTGGVCNTTAFGQIDYTNITTGEDVCIPESAMFDDFIQKEIDADGKFFLMLRDNTEATHNFIEFHSPFAAAYDDRPCLNLTTQGPPVISVSSPTDGDKTQDVPIDFSLQVSADTPTVNCTLTNETDTFDSVDDQATDTPFTLTVTNDYDQSYTDDFNITCIDQNGLSSSDVITLTVDTFTPLVTVNVPAANNSVLSGNITFDVSCYDDNVWILNFSLYNASQEFVSVQNDTNISQADNGVLSIEQFFETESVSDGDYVARFQCSDSHTKRLIPNYNVIQDNANKRIIFETDDGNVVSITLLNGNINSLSTTKKLDRYNFKFDLVNPSNKKYKFHLGSSNPLILIDESTGHFVSNKNWVDFWNGDPESGVTVERINDYEYYVEIQTDNLDFKSIGGLNINDFYYDLTVDNLAPPEAAEDEAVDRGVYDSVFKDILIFLLIMLISVGFLAAAVSWVKEAQKQGMNSFKIVMGIIGFVIGLVIMISLLKILFGI